MQVDKNLSFGFDQFSHDLTLALLEEETLRGGGSSATGRWGIRRRTRSTGNLRKFSEFCFLIMNILKV